MTLLVRDEEDILRNHLDYHLARGVDEILLMDNLSSDATAEIARPYERSGVLTYTYQPNDDYDQGRWVSELARRAALEHHADWVVHSDADEFWHPKAGSLKDAFRSIPPEVRVAHVKRTNFAARPETSEPFWKRMNVRYAVSRNSLGEPLPGKIAHRASENVRVAQGNHSVTIDGASQPAADAPITILHYPIRSRVQFFNKIAKGGAAYERNARLPASAGRTWRELYDLYLRGRLDEAYERETLTDRQVETGLADGTLLYDMRLTDALEAAYAESIPNARTNG